MLWHNLYRAHSSLFRKNKSQLRLACQHYASPRKQLISNEYDKLCVYECVDATFLVTDNEDVYEDLCHDHELE